MQPGDRLICAFIKQRQTGGTFKAWPLHVTIIPWFRLGEPSDRIAAGLEQAFSTVSPFTAKIQGETRLGPKKNRPAHLLEPGSYPELERLARRYLHKKRAWLVDETTKVRRPYLPHITFQGDEHLEEGESVHCGRLYIITRQSDHKRIDSEIVL